MSGRWESIAAGLIVVVAFGWVARAIWRAMTGKDGGCSSHCGGGCCGGGCHTAPTKPESETTAHPSFPNKTR